MRTRAFTLVELLVSLTLLAMATAAAMASWSISVRAPAAQRALQMAQTICMDEIEQSRAVRYSNLIDTTASAPVVRYYDRLGARANSATATGYQSRTWISVVVDRDGTSNSEDVREIRVEIWNGQGTTLMDSARTLLAYGGI